MKKIFFLFLVFTSFSFFGQIQINNPIYGNGVEYSAFGHSVALSSDGTIVAIGCPGDNINRSGSVKVFKNENNEWAQIGNDILGSPFSSLGISAALSSDGTILAVGAPGSGAPGAVNDFGYVKLYKNINNIWTQIGSTITSEDDNSYFGGSLDLSADGNVIAIGSLFYAELTGKIQVFQNINGSWTQIGQNILGSDQGGYFGMSLSLSSDGNHLAIGSYNSTYFTRKFVRLLEYNNGNWIQTADDIPFGGFSVDLSASGNQLITCDPQGSDGFGKVRVFSRTNGNFTQNGADINGDYMWDQFATCVKLSSDGSILAIGSAWFGENSARYGKVDIFKIENQNWLPKKTILGSNYDDLFGQSIALSSDGTIVAAGAPGNRGLFNQPSAGVVKIFDTTTNLSLSGFNPDHFSVYPNPATDVINIDLQRNFIFEKAIIYDNSGRIIKTATTQNINISGLQNGAYFIEMISNKGKAVKPFIKQ